MWAVDPAVADVEMIIHKQDERIISSRVLGRQDWCGQMAWTHKSRSKRRDRNDATDMTLLQDVFLPTNNLDLASPSWS